MVRPYSGCSTSLKTGPLGNPPPTAKIPDLGGGVPKILNNANTFRPPRTNKNCSSSPSPVKRARSALVGRGFYPMQKSIGPCNRPPIAFTLCAACHSFFLNKFEYPSVPERTPINFGARVHRPGLGPDRYCQNSSPHSGPSCVPCAPEHLRFARQIALPLPIKGRQSTRQPPRRSLRKAGGRVFHAAGPRHGVIFGAYLF